MNHLLVRSGDGGIAMNTDTAINSAGTILAH